MPDPAAPDPAPEPAVLDPEAAALADEAFLSEAGRALLARARPEILGAAEFAGRCDRDDPSPTGAVGCYRHDHRGGSIVVYAPADPRLRGFVVETVAHETLHAAWETLDAGERDALTALLEAELALLPADAPIREQIAGSVGSRPESRPTELFAYIGTQVWRERGIDARLEEVFGRFVTDRAALVEVHLRWRGVLDGLLEDIRSAQQALGERQGAAAQERARLTGEQAAVEQYREAYERQVAEVAAMPAEERARLQLSWVWWDGTDLPMAPADQTLDTAAALLTRDDADLAARSASLAAEEAWVATERQRIEALVTDHRDLTAQLDPTEGTTSDPAGGRMQG